MPGVSTRNAGRDTSVAWQIAQSCAPMHEKGKKRAKCVFDVHTA